MTNLPVPVPAQVVPGNFDTAALWNTNVFNGLTFLLNPPSASLYASGNLTHPTSGGNYVLPFDSEDYDGYGGHSTVTNNTRYTCQIAGLYKLRGQATFAANATGMRGLEFWVNGSAIKGGRRITAVPGASTTGLGMELTLDYRLNAGDYVELNSLQWSGASLTINGPSSLGQAAGLQILWVAA